jgi:hypothetical protein
VAWEKEGNVVNVANAANEGKVVIVARGARAANKLDGIGLSLAD